MYSSRSNSSKFPKLISIAGLIGVGKTTFADSLQHYLGDHFENIQCMVHHEAVDTNEILPLFYNDMKKWSFALQVSLLTQRHAQLQTINWNDTPNTIHIEDRLLEEDHVFATTLLNQGNMTQVEYDIYERLVKSYNNHQKMPDMVIYIYETPEKCLERIKKRGREMESGITLEYLQMLHQEYRKFIDWIFTKTPVMIVTMDDWKNKREQKLNMQKTASEIYEFWNEIKKK